MIFSHQQHIDLKYYYLAIHYEKTTSEQGKAVLPTLLHQLAQGQRQLALTSTHHQSSFHRLQLSSLAAPYHHHRSWISFNPAENVLEVVLSEVVEVAIVFCFSPEGLGEFDDFLVNACIFLFLCFNLEVKSGDLSGDLFVHGASDPFHLVFMNFLNIADAFKDVRDIIDPPLLDPQLSGRFVNIQNKLLFALDELHEAFGEERQGVLASAALLFLQFSLTVRIVGVGLASAQRALVYFYFFFLLFSPRLNPGLANAHH